MDLGGANWSIITIIAPLLLALAIAFALMRNKKAGRRDLDRTERSTHALYDQEEAKRREDSHKP
jgi:hypothetical protein